MSSRKPETYSRVSVPGGRLLIASSNIYTFLSSSVTFSLSRFPLAQFVLSITLLVVLFLQSLVKRLCVKRHALFSTVRACVPACYFTLFFTHNINTTKSQDQKHNAAV